MRVQRLLDQIQMCEKTNANKNGIMYAKVYEINNLGATASISPTNTVLAHSAALESSRNEDPNNCR